MHNKRIMTLIATATFLFFQTVQAASDVLIPIGKSIGVTLNTDGILVVSTECTDSYDNEPESPAHSAGIKPGDLIKEFNHTPVSTVEELANAISDSAGKSSSVTIDRCGKKINTLITPKQTSNSGEFKIGAWVRDTASGIGTMTYIDPSDNSFAALGHGICDPSTSNIIRHTRGNIQPSTIIDIEKGLKGKPGELKGVLSDEGNILGTVYQNTRCGIFGSLDNPQECKVPEPLPVAKQDEITTGSAHILTNIEGSKVEQFEVEILRIIPQAPPSSKNMIIKITDEKLLERTGGIVQGMSGSPIIQNGKLIGAVTHVFVNDPTRGYGIFIENMLSETE